MPRDAYAELLTALREMATLGSVGSLLGWDEQVMLSPAGNGFRADQSALISRLTHERATDPRLGDLIGELETTTLDDEQKAVVREARRDYDRATKLPTSLVEELSRTTVLSQAAWVESREKKKYDIFEPWLTKMIDLQRQVARSIGSPSGNLYDALLDAYEPGETVASITPVFDSLRPALVELVQRIVQSKPIVPTHVLRIELPIEKQKQMAAIVAKAVGFDMEAGRLDQSVHPFCTGIAPGDTRITTRYGADGFVGAFLGTLHESGHAMYEQGLPKSTHFGTALAEAASLGIHESQSRLWENQVGRGTSFWKFYMPKVREVFAPLFCDVSDHDWLFALNNVRPSFIRTESDETTYNLHIMLRFELEQAMIAGDLSASDLPAVWDEKFKSYFGLVVPDVAQGCLQDVHWSCGLFGYFPTYALGNLYAAQFYEAAGEAIPDLEDRIARGDFAPLLQWLRENIHQHGRRYSAAALCERVTSQPLSTRPLLRHLNSIASLYFDV